ncbi:Aldo/keto reductase [Gloeophyllum trabeum ATCC 11539]|uniref:Aldo/keto reductase n=1 Tax=Gloeophyllum trabeum (strain ATCC 11539 / FP-39264 / Madison 617) TaxID=670483 RepID=S7RNH8_GLOTA|nr:Aldo/keto reductase [Gloeophyllum trabeum ATCC 11539]EPQ56030.1 Aldo/keto reductase [Gloeophyllum trabeum ATCC 11539]
MVSFTDPRRVPYVRLGRSGLKISKIILGCMSYGSSKWQPWVLDEEESLKHIKFAYDRGIQTFDTANVYSNGMSEVVLGKAIKKYNLPREEIVVMTKIRGAVGKTVDTSAWALYQAGPDNVGYLNQHGLSRKHIFDAVQASLQRLQLDYIDVLQCHRLDSDTPIEETMQALHDVVKAGYVRYIGMSSCYAWQYYAITHNLTPFISMQNQYSLVYREEEREMMPTLKHFGVASIPWSPLARGAVARPLSTTEKTARQESDEMMADLYLQLGTGNKQIVGRVEAIAKKHGATMAQVALAWVMAKDVVAAPIVGSTSLEKLQDLLGALDVKLNQEDVAFLEEPYKPMAILAH